MYAVCINDDNTVSTLVNQRIYQGYKLADWLIGFGFYKNLFIMVNKCQNMMLQFNLLYRVKR